MDIAEAERLAKALIRKHLKSHGLWEFRWDESHEARRYFGSCEFRLHAVVDGVTYPIPGGVITLSAIHEYTKKGIPLFGRRSRTIPSSRPSIKRPPGERAVKGGQSLGSEPRAFHEVESMARTHPLTGESTVAAFGVQKEDWADVFLFCSVAND
jgi:hypothetical protein